MKRNLGPIDKGIRIGVALIIAALYTVGVLGGIAASDVSKAESDPAIRSSSLPVFRSSSLPVAGGKAYDHFST